MLNRTWPLVILLASLIATFPVAGWPLAAQQEEQQRQEEQRRQEQRREEERRRQEQQPPQRPQPQRPQPQRPQEQPDLRVTQGGFLSSASLYPGDMLRISVLISKTGPAGATQIAVSLVETGQTLRTFPIGASQLDRNTSFNYPSFPIPNNLNPGTYTVRLTIDPNNQIAESDEGNNTFDIPQSLTVAQRVPKGSPSPFSNPPSPSQR